MKEDAETARERKGYRERRRDNYICDRQKNGQPQLGSSGACL